MQLVGNRHASHERGCAGVERHHAFDIGRQRLEQDAVHVEGGEGHREEPERELQPQHQRDGNVPFAAVQPDARIAQPPREKDGQPDDGDQPGDPADHHRQQLMGNRR